ncbi:site-specific integrase [Desulfovibrio sp. UCD-KL4C]|uniref:tyrosine-type recombinase/integrase n=1 Tax=Desulfovibrio sp. UCD-KL4C TaxID=2578120 RepID=UPI0025C12D27|nr:site-specific integrase [Desulfovibrio sp. UCD-KL4C]
MRQRLSELSTTPTLSISLHSLTTRHLEAQLAKGISPRWFQDKKMVLKELLNASGVKPLEPAVNLDHETVRKFLDQIASLKSGHRANRYRRHILRMWAWGSKAGLTKGDCPWEVEKYKEIRNPRYIPTEDDFWKLYESADQVLDGSTHSTGIYQLEPHRKTLLLTFLHTAGRKSEILNLKKEDLDFSARKIRLWTAKRDGGVEYDWIPMTKILHDELIKHLARQKLNFPFTEYVFVNPATGRNYSSVNKMMERMCKRAGVKAFGFHAIRHLTASILDNKMIPMADIQAILRHKSPETTARYIHSIRGAKVALDEVFGTGKVISLEGKRKASAKAKA